MSSNIDLNPYRKDFQPARDGEENHADFDADEITIAAEMLTLVCYHGSYKAGWHHDLHTGELLERNHGEMMMLMVSEIAEAMEADRKGLMDDKLPHRLGVEVELADAVIRIFDFAGRFGLDLGGAIAEKLAYNATRADHKPENRRKPGGKVY